MSDVEKAVEFYQDVFNLKRLSEGEGDAFFKLGEHQFLALFRVDKVKPERMRHFGIMYAPHEAREDTILFPAFRRIVSSHEYDSLGEDFERKEQELFGKDGFESMVDKVASIEKSLGIYDLAQFTPKV